MLHRNSSRVLILGLGDSGMAAARLALAQGMAVRATDQRSRDELGTRLDGLPEEVETILGANPISALEGCSLLILSPGVDREHPLIHEAGAQGIEVIPEIEFAWRFRRDAPLAAVTGSNGKSTVTTLIHEMLLKSGISSVAGGNLGPPASDLVLSGEWDAWVLEVSSFQAESFIEFRPPVALLLNLSQDHLERHPSMREYAGAKARLFARQLQSDCAILNADDPLVSGFECPGRRRFFSLEHQADAWWDGTRLLLDTTPLIDSDELRIHGLHNIANALAASLAARELGAEPEAMTEALRNFAGLPHRHQEVFSSEGVIWIDDSKATNVGSTLSAISGYPESSVHLILGGMAKNQDFAILQDMIGRKVLRIYLIGRDAEEIGRALKGAAPMEDCGTLEEAVRRARILAQPNQWIVLAPGCASFDQYSGYPERGRHFAALACGDEDSSCR